VKSIRHKIAFYIGSVSLLVLVAGVSVSVIHYELRVRKQSAMELNGISRSFPATLHTVGMGLQNLAKTISLSPNVLETIRRDASWESISELAQIISANQLDYFEICDQRGIVALSITDTLHFGKSSGNPLVYSALKTDTTNFGLLREHDQIYLVASSAVYHSGRKAGVVTIGNTLDQGFMDRFGTIPGVAFTIWIDPAKPSLTPFDVSPLPPINDLLRKEEINALRAGNMISKSMSLRGVTCQVTFFTQQELQEGMQSICAVYRSISYMSEAWQQTLLFLFGIFVVIIIAVLQATFWLSRRVIRPLDDLAQNVQRLTELDFKGEVPVESEDEIGKLAESFNKLSDSLRRNISEKDRFAAELSRLNENLELEVNKRTEQLMHANLRLKREMAEKEDFLRAVSHDLGAPLRNIAGLARLLEKRSREHLDETSLDTLNRINNNVRVELQMVEDLLELSRIKTRRSRPTKFDLTELLGEIRESLSCAIEQRGIHITLLDLMPVICAEKNRIRQLFQNLIDNAIKYMGDQPEPRIEIGWSRQDKFYLFWVFDNGIGIPDDQKDKIFCVFRRVRSRESGNVEGKGVGLATVKTIVEMYGGEIWVESELGRGSTFYFTLDRSKIGCAAESESTIPLIENLTVEST
jgi:signal transduction histidine kinase